MSAKVRFMFAAAPDLKEFSKDFTIDSTIHSVKTKLFAEWPDGCYKPKGLGDVRMIYAGQKLEDAKKISDYRVVDGANVVFHVANVPIREPESSGSSDCCVIL